MRLSSLAQAAVATLTRSTPSGVTDSGAVTAAIWGPTSRIDPHSMDTTLTEGDPFVIGIRAVDLSGVDSVFLAVEGADLSYLPIEGNGADTVAFSINLPTSGLGGRTVTLGVFGVDVIGNVGPTVSRHLTIE